MPKHYRKRKRTYKSRRTKSMPHYRRRFKRRFKRQDRSKARLVPWSRLYQVPNVRANQTIQKVVRTSDLIGFHDPDATQIDNLTSFMWRVAQTPPGQRSLRDCFTDPTGVFPGYEALITVFRSVRFKWIKVTLTPELYEEDTAGGAGDGNYPVLHYINDNGTIAASLATTTPNTITIEEAQTFSNRQYARLLFRKPVSFNINMVIKNSPATSTPNYSSGNTWATTARDNGSTYVPISNFFYGFTEVPNGWKFKVQIQACVVCKDLLLT